VTRHGVWAAAIGTGCRQGNRLHSRTSGQFPLHLVFRHQYPACPVLLVLPENQETRLKLVIVDWFADVAEKRVPLICVVTTIKYSICSLGLLGLLIGLSVDMKTCVWVLGLFGLSVPYFGTKGSVVT
jgi:hypothetical protein